MKRPEIGIHDLVRRATVPLLAGSTRGTGFFVGPQQILTCAHVVAEAMRDGVPIMVGWGTAPVEVQSQDVRILPRIVDEDPYPWPDAAILHVDIANHLSVPIDPAIAENDPLYSYGWTAAYRPDRVCPMSVSLKYAGPIGPRTEQMLKMSQERVMPGMSGAPLLNQRTWRVCGFMKYSWEGEGVNESLGIPISAVLTQINDRSDPDPLGSAEARARWGGLVDDVARCLTAEAARVLALHLQHEHGLAEGIDLIPPAERPAWVARRMFLLDLPSLDTAVRLLRNDSTWWPKALDIFKRAACWVPVNPDPRSFWAGLEAAEQLRDAMEQPDPPVLYLASDDDTTLAMHLRRAWQSEVWQVQGCDEASEPDGGALLDRLKAAVLKACHVKNPAYWEASRDKVIAQHRKNHIVVVLPSGIAKLDSQLLCDIHREFKGLNLVLRSKEPPSPQIQAASCLFSLDPPVDDAVEDDALFLYETLVDAVRE